MSIVYSSADNPPIPPSWHRAAASLSRLATSFPLPFQPIFQLPLAGINIWAPPVTQRDDRPDIVLIPPYVSVLSRWDRADVVHGWAGLQKGR